MLSATRRRRSTYALAAGALTGVLVLTGCSEGADDATGAGTSQEDGGEDSSASGDVDPQAFLERVLTAFEEYGTARVEVRTSGASGNATAQGEVDYTGEQPAVELAVGGDGSSNPSMRVRTVGKRVYVSVPQLTGQKYVALSSGDVPGLGKLTGGGLDPRATLRQVSGAVTRVTDRGTEERDGRTLQHYEMHVDTSKLAGKGGAGKESGSPGSGGGSLPDELVYDLYLDEEDRLVRSAVDLGDQAGRTVVELRDWGADLSIGKPSQDQLADQKLGQLLQGMLGGQGNGTPGPSPSG